MPEGPRITTGDKFVAKYGSRPDLELILGIALSYAEAEIERIQDACRHSQMLPLTCDQKTVVHRFLADAYLNAAFQGAELQAIRCDMGEWRRITSKAIDTAIHHHAAAQGRKVRKVKTRE